MPSLPPFITLMADGIKAYITYRRFATSGSAIVFSGESHVYSTYAKIGVERGKTNPDLVHLRFCANNRYWARESDGGSWVVASSNQPEEDTSKLSCTLFRPTISTTSRGMQVTFHHVQSGRSVRMGSERHYLFVSTPAGGAQTFGVTDWDSLVILPKLVTFKGHNDKYLKSSWIQRHEYHQFSGDDGNKDETTYELTMMNDGRLSVRSNFFQKFWRRSPNWIWADATSSSTDDNDTVFWPVKIDDHTIVLRNLGNNMYCRSLTTEGKTNCLNASATTATREALLAVQEPVSSRDIYNVRYRLEDARIYDEEPFIAGEGSAVNQTGQRNTLAITVAYEDKHAYSYSNSWSITAGISYKFTTGIPRINQHEFSVSSEVTKSWEWSKTTEDTKTASATYTAVVPPWTSVKVNYVGTKGKCDIPFSYTQRVRLSTTGKMVTTEHTDGVFMGVNAYKYHFDSSSLTSPSQSSCFVL
ncbi:natterin-3 [Iris pallida]|uniref:Natterin-3 n=1 Tax=Iris pallida TaxID=29817 RepID=A0AAX6H8H8_IRIPA|nr:natterin-3 [Iris pallida]